MMRHTKAFTLVELLVVVTIIVVLLALLVPALDKAIYQAELAVCGTKQRLQAQGAIIYASDHKRAFPSNEVPRYNNSAHQPDLIAWDLDPSGQAGIRPIMKDYVPYKSYHDPLTGEVAFDPESTAMPTGNNKVFSNYYLFFGWQWTGAYGGKGMLRQGDAIHFYDTFNEEQVRSTVMVTERHLVRDVGLAQSTHPDWDKGVMENIVAQNAPFGVVAIGGQSEAYFTFSTWQGGDEANPRGMLDLNYAHNDGSVQRMLQVEHRDNRLRYCPSAANSETAQVWKGLLPPK